MGGWQLFVCVTKLHSIKFFGEANDVTQETIDEWLIKLKDLIKGYELKDIANCDETGLFFRALPSKTLTLKNEKCIGGKQSKERLTVLLCGFADGKMEKPFVIGKAMKPRCFKNINIADLPVVWRANKKAWMMGNLMEEWLHALNDKMKRQKRNICLFLDNAACHPHLALSNIKLCFFPANTTSITQPMDQGVIQCMKVHYRKHVIQSLIANMNKSRTVSELTKTISVLDAVRWIANAMNQIKPDCVIKCFVKAGFQYEETELGGEEDFLQEPIKELNSFMNDIESQNIDPLDYINIDRQLTTEPGFQTLEDLIQLRTGNDEEEEGEDKEGDGLGIEVIEGERISNFSEAMNKLAALEEFSMRISCPSMINKILELRTATEKEASLSNRARQATLYDLWKK